MYTTITNLWQPSWLLQVRCLLDEKHDIFVIKMGKEMIIRLFMLN